MASLLRKEAASPTHHEEARATCVVSREQLFTINHGFLDEQDKPRQCEEFEHVKEGPKSDPRDKSDKIEIK